MIDKSWNVCCQKHSDEYSEKYAIVSQDNDTVISSPKWYADVDGSGQLTKQRIVDSHSEMEVN